MNFAIDATQVGSVIAYMAPGFLAQVGYRSRYPAPERSAGYVFILSVVLSLPLVALANALINGSHKPTQLGYVAALTVGSFTLGYIVAVIRGWSWTKKLLALCGYHIQPEGSIYSQTLKKIGGKAKVEVELKNGRRVRGIPGNGPETKDDGINELYLTYPEAIDANGNWTSVGAALIIPLVEVSLTVLSVDPTNPLPTNAQPASNGVGSSAPEKPEAQHELVAAPGGAEDRAGTGGRARPRDTRL